MFLLTHSHFEIPNVNISIRISVFSRLFRLIIIILCWKLINQMATKWKCVSLSLTLSLTLSLETINRMKGRRHSIKGKKKRRLHLMQILEFKNEKSNFVITFFSCDNNDFLLAYQPLCRSQEYASTRTINSAFFVVVGWAAFCLFIRALSLHTPNARVLIQSRTHTHQLRIYIIIYLSIYR